MAAFKPGDIVVRISEAFSSMKVGDMAEVIGHFGSKCCS
jgi:hypothetical protein